MTPSKTPVLKPKKNKTLKNVSKSKTSQFQYPWSAAIVRVDDETHHEIICHGSLISRDVVLTAAHCYKIKGIIPKLHIVIGSVEPLKEGSPAVEIYNEKRKIKPIQEIKEVYFHSAYQVSKKEAYNDLAITRLKQGVKFNKFMHPLCLPMNAVVQNAGEETYRSVQSHNVIVTGYVSDNHATTGKLHEIEPQIRTQSFCNDKFSNRPRDEEVIQDAIPNGFDSSIFCAAVETGTEASCRGDSGAPLFRYEAFNGNLSDFRYVQIGTLHGSINSCDSTYPGIYSRLEEPSILAFIKSHGQVNGSLRYSAPEAGK